MRYLALALDYDGTLATDGCVPPDVVAALVRVRASGRKLIMVTGREMRDLHRTFARVDLFDRVIAENGALLFVPETGRTTVLASPPPESFWQGLKNRGVRVSAGDVVVATWLPYRREVEEAIAASGLDLEIIVNKDALMVLPPGINKGKGIARAAADLQLDLRSIVGMGDAENDHSLLRACGLGVAVANAVKALKDQADAVTEGSRGEGVVEVIEALVRDDLAGFTARPRAEVEVAPSEAEAKTRSVVPGAIKA